MSALPNPALHDVHGSAWAPLRQSAFRSLWLAAVAANAGLWMRDVAAGWLMTSLAPSPSMVALVQAATTLPVFLLSFPGGALADIVDRRHLLIGTQVWTLAMTALLAGLTAVGATTQWVLLALTFALGLGAALMMPAWAATTPELVPKPQLGAAIALNAMGMNVARAVGPALAGVIVAAAGPAAVFALSALAVVGVIVALYRWRREPRTSTLPAERFASALRTGFRFARHSPPLKRVLVRAGVFFLFASALWAFLPLIVRHELHGTAALYGWMLACVGVGAVIGAVTLPGLRSRLGPDRTVAIGATVAAAVALGLAFVHDVWLLSFAMLVMGAAWISVISSLQVSAQMALPAWVRARGLALFLTVFQGAMAAGSVLCGHLADHTGIPVALAVSAIGALLGIAATWRLRIGDHVDADLSPAMHWPQPHGRDDVDDDSGPVVVSLEYRIDPGRAAAFREAMAALHRIRKRDGAFSWGLFRDTADRSRHIEYFMIESWVEHLRQHERMTVADLAVEAAAKSFHVGPDAIVVTHWVAASGERDTAAGQDPRLAVPLIAT
ncbi:MAG: MFS transporter [Burkholderiales bacterium]